LIGSQLLLSNRARRGEIGVSKRFRFLGVIAAVPLLCLALVGCAPALTLEVSSPIDGAELTESPVTVEGIVSYSTAEVVVNGVEVPVAGDGSFSTEVELVEGENQIVVIVTYHSFYQVTDVIHVTYTPSV